MINAWRRWRPKFWHVVVITLAGLSVSIAARAQDFAEITGALSAANTEVRGSVFPAVAAILGAVVLIAVAARVVAVISSRN